MKKTIVCLALLLVGALGMGTVPALAAEPVVVTVDRCETGIGWNAGADSFVCREGIGAIRQKQGSILLEYKIAQLDTSALDEDACYLEFWCYVRDASLLRLAPGNGQVELNSTGRADDDNEISWELSEVDFQTGWNYLSFSLAEANRTGSVDFENLKFFRFYQVGTDILEVWVDNVILTDTAGAADDGVRGTVDLGEEDFGREPTAEQKREAEHAFYAEVQRVNERQPLAAPVWLMVVDGLLGAAVVALVVLIVLQGRKRA